jgi:hypothetical protein
MKRHSVADVIDRARAGLRQLGAGGSGTARFHLVPVAPPQSASRPDWRAVRTRRPV